MPMSDFATARLAIETFLIVAVCGFGVVGIVAALLKAIDDLSGPKSLAPSRQVAPARRPTRR